MILLRYFQTPTRKPFEPDSRKLAVRSVLLRFRLRRSPVAP
jgi:hypothetical protein